jgi:O-antigen/teichoic acid export membrane protein
MSGPLTRSVVQGATWTGIAQAMGQGFRLAAMIVLARLLVPEDFGVVAMAAVFTSLVSQIVDLGFNQAIVQRKEITPSHLSTTFWTSWAIGIAFCLVMVAISPVVGMFFGNDSVGPVLAVLSLSFVITPLGSVHGALMRRKLEFFRFSIAEIGGAAIYLATAVSLAFAGLGIWSLVFGALAGDSAYVALRWVLCRWHPSLVFSRNSLRDLWRFGLNITGTKFVGFLATRLDYLIIGRFLTPAAVGFYNLGRRTADYPAHGLSLVVTRVSFPSFSSIQDDDERLRRGFIKTVTFVSMIGLPLLVGLATVAPELVRVVFGHNWISAVSPMQILCIAMGINMLSDPAMALFWSKGRPDIDLKLSTARLVLLVIGLLIGVQFGTAGVALGVLGVTAVLWLAQQSLANRLINLKMRDYLVALRPAVVGSVIMALILLAFRYSLASPLDLPNAVVLFSSVLLGAATYFAVLKIGRVQAFGEMIGLVLEMLRPYARSIMAKIFFRKAVPYHIEPAQEKK